jgi:hypothetical protein
LKTTQASKSNDREDIRSRFKKAAALADPNSIKFKDVQKALGHYRKSLGAGQAYLKLQKTKLSEKNYNALVAGVNQMMQLDKAFILPLAKVDAILKTIFSPIFETYKTAIFSLEQSVSNIDFEKLNVEIKAASALMGYLEKAVDDPDIKKSAALLSLAEFMLKEIGGTSIGEGADKFLRRFTAQAEGVGVSKNVSRAAKQKNIAARSLVLTEWNARTNKSETKKSFAERWELLLHMHKDKKIKCDVTADRIRNYWLPKTTNTVKKQN